MRLSLYTSICLAVLGCGYSFDSDRPADPSIPRQRKLPSMLGPVITEDQLGAPFYSKARIRGVEPGTEANNGKWSATFSTEDSVQQVEAFYRDKMGAPIEEKANPVSLTYKHSGRTIRIEINNDGKQTKIVITNTSSG
jgi:hypothetical protein